MLHAHELHEPKMSQKCFGGFCKLLERETGIVLHAGKQIMLQGRLRKRLAELGLGTYDEYLTFLVEQDPRGIELKQMVNCMTTNKTDFFREPHHFQGLCEQVLQPLKNAAARGGERKLRIWCAASSTGEEPYTIAMTLREFFGHEPGWDIRVLASDIDTEVLRTAEAGRYRADRAAEIPADLRAKYFSVSGHGDAAIYEAKPELKQYLTFRQINLIEPQWRINTKFDAIFCRNVMIYFNAETQDRLLTHFTRYLKRDAYLYIGHSESILRLCDQFESCGSTTYRYLGNAEGPTDQPVAAPTTSRSSLSSSRATAVASSASSGSASTRQSSMPAIREAKPRLDPQIAALPQYPIIVGEVHASDQPCCITTLLGSCISCCLYDETAKIGGMNHFMLPEGSDSDTACASYGVHAMELLINQIMQLGGDRRRLQAKIFGGARVVKANGPMWRIGEKNLNFVRGFLKLEQIPLAKEFVGGERGMQVRFLPHSGQAFVRLFDATSNPEIIKVKKPKQPPVAADSSVTLF